MVCVPQLVIVEGQIDVMETWLILEYTGVAPLELELLRRNGRNVFFTQTHQC